MIGVAEKFEQRVLPLLLTQERSIGFKRCHDSNGEGAGGDDGGGEKVNFSRATKAACGGPEAGRVVEPMIAPRK